MMETSTPLPSELRRRTLIANTMNTTNVKSPLRRSVNMNASVLHNSSMHEISNDDDERADRRNQLRIQKRLSSVATTPKAVNLSDSFIAEQFVMYTHLFTENKITTKNAWKVQIIDMLKPLCQKSGQDILQVASTSIDISAKVYGIRVDDVHSEGLKLASNMARVSEDAVPPGIDDEDAPEEGSDPTATAKKKKKKKVSTGLKTTVNKNPKAHLGKLSKLEPADFTTRVNADTGTIDNLFTNVLKQSGSSFVLLDKMKRLLETTDTSVINVKKTVLSDLPLPQTNSSICAPLNDFIVDQWDPEQEKLILNQDKSVVLSQMQPVVFDDKGFPVPELDGSIVDCFENMDADDMDHNDIEEDHVSEVRVQEAPEFRGNIAIVADFRPMESTVQFSEYSFNSIVTTNDGKYIDQIWAGPSHWKLKCIRRSTAKFTGQKSSLMEKPRQKRKKSSPEMIDFDEDPMNIDFSKKLVVKKRAAADIDKITFPVKDQSCAKVMAEIRELILRPGVCVVEKKNNTTNDEDYEVAPYNYENPNDNLYCSMSQPSDDVDDADDNMGEGEPSLTQHPENLADNLVDNPEMVPHTYMHYALRAKQIDMKKLKKAIWHKLTDSVGANFEIQKDAVVSQNFSDLYKSLPPLLSPKEKSELSCPLAFVALLHLCNENNLHLTQLPDYKDFEIRQHST